MAKTRTWFTSPLFLGLAIVACVIVGAVLIFRPMTKRVLYPRGVKSLTIYYPSLSIDAHAVIPSPGGGAFYYERGKSSSGGETGVIAGSITATGDLVEYIIPTKDEFEAVVADRSGTLWGAIILDDPRWPLVWRGALVKVADARHVVPRLKFPTPLGYANSLTVGPDGDLWFALPDAHAVGKIDQTDHLSTINVGGDLEPKAIVFDRAGNFYVSTEDAAAKRPDTIVMLERGSKCCGRTLVVSKRIGWQAAGNDSGIWFIDEGENKIRHVAKNGSIDDVPGTARQLLDPIVIQGNSLWFSVTGGLGRMDLKSRSQNILELPDREGQLSSLAVSSLGEVWGAEDLRAAHCFGPCSGIIRVVP